MNSKRLGVQKNTVQATLTQIAHASTGTAIVFTWIILAMTPTTITVTKWPAKFQA